MNLVTFCTKFHFCKYDSHQLCEFVYLYNPLVFTSPEINYTLRKNSFSDTRYLFHTDFLKANTCRNLLWDEAESRILLWKYLLVFFVSSFVIFINITLLKN